MLRMTGYPKLVVRALAIEALRMVSFRYPQTTPQQRLINDLVNSTGRSEGPLAWEARELLIRSHGLYKGSSQFATEISNDVAKSLFPHSHHAQGRFVAIQLRSKYKNLLGEMPKLFAAMAQERYREDSGNHNRNLVLFLAGVAREVFPKIKSDAYNLCHGDRVRFAESILKNLPIEPNEVNSIRESTRLNWDKPHLLW